jgi:hypothetical protein
MEVIVGLVLGLAVGCGFVWRHSSNPIRKKELIRHVPDLPYLILLYLVLTTYMVVINAPGLAKVIMACMVGVESAMLLLGKRLK